MVIDLHRKSLRNVNEAQILSPKNLNNRNIEAVTGTISMHMGSPLSLPPIAVSPAKRPKPSV